MHIELELDDELAECLLRQKQSTNQNLADVITEILTRTVKNTPPVAISEGAKVLRILEERQLLGCMEGDGNLSVDYKKELWNDR